MTQDDISRMAREAGLIWWTSHQMPLLERFAALIAAAERAKRDALLGALKNAAEAIEHWGAYVPEYFGKKHDLWKDIDAARAAIRSAEEKA